MIGSLPLHEGFLKALRGRERHLLSDIALASSMARIGNSDSSNHEHLALRRRERHLLSNIGLDSSMARIGNSDSSNHEQDNVSTNILRMKSLDLGSSRQPSFLYLYAAKGYIGL